MKKPRRFIVEIHDDIDLASAFFKCLKVAQGGLVSTTRGQQHHCHLTTFHDETMVYVTLNRSGSERFRVSKETK